LDVPYQPCKDLSMNFVVCVPDSEGYNAICVVVDRLPLMKHLVLCHNDTDGQIFDSKLIYEVFNYIAYQ
jgi:hypothetical protein